MSHWSRSTPFSTGATPSIGKWHEHTDHSYPGIAGSLRQASYNRAALRAAGRLVPEGVRLDIFDLAGIPPFNQDDEETRRHGWSS